MDFGLFEYQDYKTWLHDQISKNKKVSGYQTRLAKAAGCQKSFLSQVLNSHVHLTVDHAARLCEFWSFDEDGTTFFMDLVLYARAASKELRHLSEKRIAKMRQLKRKLANRVSGSHQMPLRDQLEFYSAWYVSAVYMLLGIKSYQTTEKISKRLGVSEQAVTHATEILDRLGLITRDEKGWKKTQNDLFLKSSPMRPPYLMSWRQISSVRLQLEDPDAFHFTTLYTLSRENLERIRKLLVETIETTRQVGVDSPGPEEELVCLNLDLFRV